MTGRAVHLVSQLLPALLSLQCDAVANVRIALARCLVQHSHCLLGGYIITALIKPGWF